MASAPPRKVLELEAQELRASIEECEARGFTSEAEHGRTKLADLIAQLGTADPLAATG